MISKEKRFVENSLLRLGLVVLLITCSCGLVHGSDWLIENVDLSGQVFWNADIECQNPNRVHLFYDRDWPGDDYYSVRDSYGWTTGGLPNFAYFDMELDAGGSPRMVTTRRPSTVYQVEYWQETSPNYWTYLNVASNVNARDIQLEIDTQDNAHMLYIDRNTSSLKYCKIVGDLGGYITMDTDTVATDSAFDEVLHSQLKMDSAGQPNLIWYEYSTEKLKRAYQPTVGGAWQIDTIYSGMMFNGFEAAFDSTNNLHVAYTDKDHTGNYGEIRHAIYDGSQWIDERISSMGSRVEEILIDSLDQPHIAYVEDVSGKDLFCYATDLGSHWHNEIIAELNSTMMGPEEMEMDLDLHGNLHLAFRGDADELRYARRSDLPRPQSTEEVPITVSVDAEATSLGTAGFMVTDGAYNITIANNFYYDIDNRGILEFDLSSLDANAEIVAARLELNVNSFQYSYDDPPSPTVYAYEGDGLATPEDAEKTTTVIGYADEIDLGSNSIILDPDVLAAQLSENSWLGLLLICSELDDTRFTSLENITKTPATLILDIAILLPGDANRDGRVDETDAGILADNWLSSNDVSWGEGDFNGNGVVDAADATILAANWHPSSSSNATVPEPQTLGLLLSAVVVLMRRK